MVAKGKYYGIFQWNLHFLLDFSRRGVPNPIFMGKSHEISLFAIVSHGCKGKFNGIFPLYLWKWADFLKHVFTYEFSKKNKTISFLIMQIKFPESYIYFRVSKFSHLVQNLFYGHICINMNEQCNITVLSPVHFTKLPDFLQATLDCYLLSWFLPGLIIPLSLLVSCSVSVIVIQSSTPCQQTFPCCTVCLVWLALRAREIPYD